MGGVVAAAALVLGHTLSRWFATGCSAPDAKFACLGEGLVLMFAGPVVVPLVLWWLLRVFGVPHAFLTSLLSCVLAVALAFPALQLVEGVHALVGGAPIVASSATEAVVVGLAAALACGAAAACGVLLVGGRVTWREWVATALAVVLALGTAAAVERWQTERRHRVELEDAAVPLLGPPQGWVVQSLYVSDAGGLSLDVHPQGTDPYGERSVDIVVTSLEPDDECGFSSCRTTPDGLVMASSDYGSTVVLRVDGAFAEVGNLDPGQVGEQAVLEVARGLRPLDVDALLALEA